MTVATFVRVWRDQTITDQKEVLVLLSMADNGADDEGYCALDIESASRSARISTDEAWAIVDELERRGVIQNVGRVPSGSELYRISHAEVQS